MAASSKTEPQYGERAETSHLPGLSQEQVAGAYLEIDKTDRAAAESRRSMFAVLGLLTWLGVGIPLVVVAWKIALGW